MPAVPVKDVRERKETGYQAGVTNVGKIPQLTRDIPQSLSVITEQLIQDRNAATLAEALRNVPGVTFNAGEGGRNGDNITIRGYSAVGDLYLDTIRDVAQYNRDTFNLSEIDILRGSASMLFGRGSTGGVVNQVSKVPFLMNQSQASITVGSFDYVRLLADVNTIVGDNAALRINAMGTDSESFRNGPHYQRWGVAPSVTWGLGTRDELNLAFFYLDEKNIPDYGVPFYQGRPLPVPVDESYYGLTNADYEKYETAIATATYIHRFTPATQIKNVLRYGDYQRDLWPSAPRLQGNPNPLLPTSVITRGRPGREGHDKDWTNQTDFTTNFETGTLKHTVLVGLELANENSWTQRWGQLPGVTIPTTTVGNPNDSPPLPPNFFVRNVTQETSFDSKTAGIYAQDFLQFNPFWKLLAGVRYDYFDADYERIGPLTDYSRTDRVWSFRTGLLFQPDDIQSYYVSYGSSFNPSGELYALDPRGANTPPEKNYNYELGAKYELFDGNLSLQAVLYRSEKTNERNTDPLVVRTCSCSPASATPTASSWKRPDASRRTGKSSAASRSCGRRSTSRSFPPTSARRRSTRHRTPPACGRPTASRPTGVPGSVGKPSASATRRWPTRRSCRRTTSGMRCWPMSKAVTPCVSISSTSSTRRITRGSTPGMRFPALPARRNLRST